MSDRPSGHRGWWGLQPRQGAAPARSLAVAVGRVRAVARRTAHVIAGVALACAAVAGCGATAGEAGDMAGTAPSAGGVVSRPGGAAGFVGPGAADFGAFRALINAGKVPAPEVLDDLGFFAEHKLDFPAPTCGEDLCMHALLGIRGNLLTGTPCTVVQLGLNSPLDPAALPRPKLHVVAVVEVATAMSGIQIAAVREGLRRLVLAMKDQHPGDLLTLIAFDEEVRTLAAAAGHDAGAAIDAAIDGLSGDGLADLHAGLAAGYAAAEAATPAGYAARVVLAATGEATAGLVDGHKTLALVQAMAQKGIGLTTVGSGVAAHAAKLVALAEAGQGTAYIVDDSEAVHEVFVEEANTALFPVAAAVELRFDAGEAWAVRGGYGARDLSIDDDGATIRIPTLYLARRLAATAPIEGGRRGGGGAMQLELMPLATSLDAPQLHDVGAVEIRWRHIGSGADKVQTQKVLAPQLSAAMVAQGMFTNATVEKGFVMLNLLVALRTACALARDGDVGAARGTLQAIGLAVEAWLAVQPDPDIADDLVWVRKLDDLLSVLPSSVQTPIVPPPEPWPVD